MPSKPKADTIAGAIVLFTIANIALWVWLGGSPNAVAALYAWLAILAASIVILLLVLRLVRSRYQRHTEGRRASEILYDQVVALKSNSPLQDVDEITQRITDALPPSALLDAFQDTCRSVWKADVADIPSPVPQHDNTIEHAYYREELRKLLVLFDETPHAVGVFCKTLIASLRPLAAAVPPAAPDALFSVRMHDIVDVPNTVEKMLESFHDAEVTQIDLFKNTRRTLDANLQSASAALPARRREQGAVIRPTEYEGDDVVDVYLKGTPFETLFMQEVPVSIPEDRWFEHTHIIARTGGGKTQLLQTIFLHHVRKPVRPSFLIVDSQGRMLDLIDRKFRTELGDKLIHIDPTKNLPPLNIFDINRERFEEYTEIERRQFGNRLLALFRYLFTAGSAPLTDKQRTLFDWSVRLLLFGVPKAMARCATLQDLHDLMLDAAPYLPAIRTLSPDGQSFFLTELPRQYSQTRGEVLQRFHNITSDETLKEMLSAPRNAIDMFDLLNTGHTILINTDRGFLQDSSAFFGRFFIMLAQQAMFQRTSIKDAEPHPVFLMIDEAQEYFDETVEDFLDQGRKFKVACVFAHQRHTGQTSDALAAVLDGAAIQFATRVAPADIPRLERSLHASREFIAAQDVEPVEHPVRPRWADFACYVQGTIKRAVRMRLRFFQLENYQPTEQLTEKPSIHSEAAPPPAHDDIRQSRETIGSEFVASSKDSPADPAIEPSDGIDTDAAPW